MAITFPTVFQSSIATDPAATAAGYLTPTRYNQGCSIAGLSSTSGALLYSTDATTLAQDGTNLLYTTASGPRLQVGSGSGTSAGWLLGYLGTSGIAGAWGTNVTPSTTNYYLQAHADGSTLILNGGSAINLRRANSDVFRFAGTGGAILSGGTDTAGTNPLLSGTITWNAGAVTFTGIKFTITDTASAAGSLAMQILGGASGTTNLFKVDKSGNITNPGQINAAGTIDSAINVQSAANFWARTDGGIYYFGLNNDANFNRQAAGVIGVGTTVTGFAGRLKLTSAIAAGVAIASLNASPTTGEIQSVTDALAPVVGNAVASGGSAKALVWWNGAQWTVIGV